MILGIGYNSTYAKEVEFNLSSLGDRLKEAREKKNLKQIQVMRHTGINNKTLSGYENNVSEPDMETLQILANLYDVKIDYFYPKKTGLEGVYSNNTEKNEMILREIVEKYNLDLTIPGQREKVEQIIQIVLNDHLKK